jgi:AraC-like DNA-binding protein
MKRIIFNSADLPGDERLRRETWIDSLSSGYVRLRADHAPGTPFNGELKIVLINDVVIGTLSGTVDNISRTTVDVNIQNTDNVVLLSNIGPHVTRIEQDGKTADCVAGQAVLIEQCEPSVIRVAERNTCNLLAIQAPRRNVRGRLLDLENRFMTPISVRSSAMALARAYIDILLDQPDGGDPPMTQLASQHVTDLIAAAVDVDGAIHEQRSQGLRMGRLAMIRRELDRAFREPSFSLTVLAGRLAVTPRYVQALLAEAGTSFTDELTARRLGLARDMLTSSRCAHMNVAEVAYECGFSTISHFHRVFRHHFGETPNSLRSNATGHPR